MELKLKSIEIDGMGRFYQSANTGNWYPSVTTVTGWAKRDFWAKWRQSPENKKNSDEAMRRGTALHTLIEEHLNKDTLRSVDDKTKQLFEQMLPNLDKINKVVAQEMQLCSDSLRMAGRFDCIGEYEGVLSVIDFKSAKSARKEEWISNYFEQTAAYSYMWLESTGVRIPQIVILVSAEDGVTQVFKKNPNDYKIKLGEAIKGYWSDNNFEELQRKINEVANQPIQA
jgi:genome maintenance exonuclease 1